MFSVLFVHSAVPFVVCYCMACRGYIWPHMGSVMRSVQVTASCCSLLHRVEPSHGAWTTALLQLVDEHTVQALERSAIFLAICFFILFLQ